MSWLAVAAGVAWVGGKVIKGHQAYMGAADVSNAQQAARDMYKDRVGLLGEERALGQEQAALGWESARKQYAGGVSDVSLVGQTALSGVRTSKAGAIAQTGLESSGTIESSATQQTKAILEKSKNDITKLFETRQVAEKEKEFKLTDLDLAYRRGEMSAEEAREATLTELDATPTTHWEGAFG